MRRLARPAADEAWRADEALLARRLADRGLRRGARVTMHANRSVMVSVSRGTARVHRGYVYAPDPVLDAVVAFLEGSPAERRHAERALLAFPVERWVPPRRSAPIPPRDRRLVAALTHRHARLNERYFEGILPAIPFRVSPRMRTQLGAVVLDGARRPVEIVISRRHIEREGWVEAERTLLHEMIHQWQAESGRAVDHGRDFRRMAETVGIDPGACRDLPPRPAAVEGSLFSEA